MGTDEVTEEQTDVDSFASNISGLDATPDVGPQGKGDLEMATLTGASLNATLEHVVMTSTHPTDIDPRNLAVMISLSAFIISTGSCVYMCGRVTCVYKYINIYRYIYIYIYM